MHILVLSEQYEGFETCSSYTDYVSDKEDVKILIITSPGNVCKKDKEKCLAYAEVEKPSSNGRVELFALEFHRKYRIDRVYTNQEELVLRAAAIRKALGLKDGLLPEQAIQFRDKEVMKAVAARNGVPVPNFKRISGPVDVIDFCESNGFPIVIKPTLASDSMGVRVIKDAQDMESYLEKEFFSSISDMALDFTGNLIAEQFIPSTMYHVNGYCKNGKLEYVWPFQYVNTNLNFTKGEEYGNISIPPTHPKYPGLIRAIEKVLDALPCGDHMVFHCELFEAENGFLLCEIACRKPGASICLLIDLLEGGNGTFPETEFRISNGIEPRHKIRCLVNQSLENDCVGDLLIRRPLGRLIKLPKPQECPISNLKVIPIAKENSVYHGFDVNVRNTSMRMIAVSQAGTNQVLESLTLGSQWYRQNVHYISQ
ncbi:ATP-grasp domain-containing protein [Gorgonomyces haynaldii]|nr:ATP-grasp domain-containing protein [Gorgonomyces haynaldii]